VCPVPISGIKTLPFVRHLSARLCHYFVLKKVVHIFSGCMLYQFEPCMEVVYFLLTQEDMRFRMLHTAEVVVSPQAYAPGGYAPHRAVVGLLRGSS
jgi:hypothetical protein